MTAAPDARRADIEATGLGHLCTDGAVALDVVNEMPLGLVVGDEQVTAGRIAGDVDSDGTAARPVRPGAERARAVHGGTR